MSSSTGENEKENELKQWLINTRHWNAEIRWEALTKVAEECSLDPEYYSLLVKIISNEGLPEQLRVIAAGYFKNYLARHPNAPPLNISTISTIKGMLLKFPSPGIVLELTATLELFEKLPDECINVFNELLAKFNKNNDFRIMNVALTILHHGLIKLRSSYPTLIEDLEELVKCFGERLFRIFKFIYELQDVAQQSSCLDSQVLICGIFHSLALASVEEMPEVLEGFLRQLVPMFEVYLRINDHSGGMGELQASIIEFSTHLFTSYDCFEVIHKGSTTYLLVRKIATSTDCNSEKLNVAALRFLAKISVAPSPDFFNLIVRPNLLLTSQNEDIFTTDYRGFVYWDRGYEEANRRRVACELLKKLLSTVYKEDVSHMLLSFLRDTLDQGNVPWEMKEAAIYILDYIVEERVNVTGLPDVPRITTTILTELNSGDVDTFPMLKARAIEFLTTSIDRNPPVDHYANSLLPDVIKFLHSKFNVVHSYAANFIERLVLVLKGPDLKPHLLTLMIGLFSALTIPESYDNIHMIKCITEVLRVATLSRNFIIYCTEGFIKVLSQVFGNPKNPLFNHHVFDSVALLIRRSCEQDPSIIEEFEARLVPCLCYETGSKSLYSYKVQLLTLLVDLNQHPDDFSMYPPFIEYLKISNKILKYDWETPIVPSYSRFIRAFLRKGPSDPDFDLSEVIDKWEQLISSPSSKEEGFYLLLSVVENTERGVLRYHMDRICRVVIAHMNLPGWQESIQPIVVFMSLYMLKHGFISLVGYMNSVDTTFLGILFNNFWITVVQTITADSMHKKLLSMSSLKLLFESSSPLNPDLRTNMLESIVSLILKEDDHTTIEKGPDVLELGEIPCYFDKFVCLHNAGWIEGDIATLRGINECIDHVKILIDSLRKALQTTGNLGIDPGLLQTWLLALKRASRE